MGRHGCRHADGHGFDPAGGQGRVHVRRDPLAAVPPLLRTGRGSSRSPRDTRLRRRRSRLSRALGDLWEHLHHQGSTIAVGALAVPFLLRITAIGLPGLRADTLRLVAEIGRGQHSGDGTREGLLHVTEDPLEVEGTTMCPTNWTIQAARDAITDDLHLLFPLLPDPDPDVRSATAFVLAAATGEIARVSSALHRRLAVEDDPVVRVSLILAIAQLAREHQDEDAPSWARELWSDTGRPPEIRIGEPSPGCAWSTARPPTSFKPSWPTRIPTDAATCSSGCRGSDRSTTTEVGCGAASTKCSRWMSPGQHDGPPPF